jgi:cbb3-type cytochrome oxidase maturation protein
MNEATVALTIMSLLILLSFVGFFVWGLKSGQFKNVEEAKYNMFKQPDKVGKDKDNVKPADKKEKGD